MAENFDLLALNWDNEPRRVERAKIVANEILKAISSSHALEALEYGCGTGLLSLNLQPYLKHITLADSSEGMLSVLNQKIQQQGFTNMSLAKLDLTKDPIPDKIFDMVYTLMTLHHIIDVDSIIDTFHKLLSPSGYLCISDLVEEDGSFHDEDFEGHNGFNIEELSAILEKSGFCNITTTICYEAKKQSKNGELRAYPVFLMIAQKK